MPNQLSKISIIVIIMLLFLSFSTLSESISSSFSLPWYPIYYVINADTVINDALTVTAGRFGGTSSMLVIRPNSTGGPSIFILSATQDLLNKVRWMREQIDNDTITFNSQALGGLTPLPWTFQVGGDDIFGFTANSAISSKTLDMNGNRIKNIAGLKQLEGTDRCMGIATLTTGTVTVNTGCVTTNSRVFITNQDGVGPVGSLFISARTNGVSFTITSTNLLDASKVAWLIMEPS